MRLIINGVAVIRSSLGARRYYAGIVEQLNWPGEVCLTELPRWRRLERPLEIFQRGCADAVFWSPSHRGPLRAHNHVMTVLDCINVEYTYRGDWRLPLFRRFFSQTLNSAAAVVAISNATRDAILRNYEVDERKIIAIPGPIDLRPGMPAVPEQQKTDAKGKDKFVLMVTNSLPHKNTAAALRAFAATTATRRGVSLRVVGSVATEALNDCLAQGVRVEVHRSISEVTLDNWLTECLFLFSPSLDEGLNLPVAEALSLGSNVLCSDVAAHREFYSGQVAWCDPRRLDSMVQALEEAFERHGRWSRSIVNRVRISFGDVAAVYRRLFLRVASGAMDSSSLSSLN